MFLLLSSEYVWYYWVVSTSELVAGMIIVAWV